MSVFCCICSGFIYQRIRNKPYLNLCLPVSPSVTHGRVFVHFDRENEFTVYDDSFSVLCMHEKVRSYSKLSYENKMAAVQNLHYCTFVRDVCAFHGKTRAPLTIKLYFSVL